MERIEDILLLLETSLNTGLKRHIIGGILMSVSLLFAGLSVTIFSVRNDEDEENYDGRKH